MTNSTTVRPTHIAGVDMWDCPCRECTHLDWSGTVGAHETGDERDRQTLAEYRRNQWPEFYS